MTSRLLFAVASPLGYQVELQRNRWREIVRFKHPALNGKQASVRECLIEPDFICASEKDPAVHLYYRQLKKDYLCVVVAGNDPKGRFVVTAYFARNIKKGAILWTK